MKSRAALFLCLIVVLACSAPGQQAVEPAAGGDDVVATIDGQPLSLSDLGVDGQLMRLRQEEYETKLNGIDSKIAEILLRREAEKQGLEFEQYLQQELGDKIEGPTDEQVERFYEQQKARIGRPIEEVRSQIVRVLRQELVRQAHDALVSRLREGAEIQVLLDPPRVDVKPASRMRGPADAPIDMIEFSDFQCPFCRQVQPALAELRTKYGDKIRWSFKDLPLSSIHPLAQKAAEAARCAADHDKFWEFRAAMFASSTISPELYRSTAQDLGLDVDEFQACIDSNQHRDEVLADAAEAEALGISGTPAFVINGILVSGAQPLENFVAIIDRELAKANP